MRSNIGNLSIETFFPLCRRYVSPVRPYFVAEYPFAFPSGAFDLSLLSPSPAAAAETGSSSHLPKCPTERHRLRTTVYGTTDQTV